MNNRNKRIETLDVLRAIALILISIYHWFSYKGSYIGVVIFFVLSGYLFTPNIFYKNEELRDGIKKRISKLYPSLIIVIFISTVILYMMNDMKGLELTYKNSVIYSILSLTNIYQIVAKLSYFDNYSLVLPLTHLWALSFQFQMYIAMPIFIIGLKKLNATKKNVITLLISLSLLSAGYMAYLYSSKVDFSRIYYGTDTRMFSFLVASAVGIYYKGRTIKNRNERALVNFLGFLGIILTIYYIFFVDYQNSFNYYGGMYIVSLLLSFTVAMFEHKKKGINEKVQVILNPFIRLGQHQYEYYLWQYPIMIIAREYFKFTTLSFNEQIFIQIVIMIVLSELTHYLVTKNWVKKLSFVLLGSILTMLVVTPNYVNEDLEEMKKIQAVAEQNSSENNTNKNNETETINSENTTSTTKTEEENSAENTTEDVKVDANMPTDTRGITFIGDSVMEMTKNDIKKRYPNAKINTKVGRQFKELLSIISTLKQQGALNKTVVISLGTNGNINPKDMEQAVKLLENNQVYLVNTVVPLAWEKSVNDTIVKTVAANSNFTLVDWYSFAKGKKSYFYKDGVHPKPDAATKYVQLIYDKVSK